MPAAKLKLGAFIDGVYYYAGQVVDLPADKIPTGSTLLEEVELDMLDEEPELPLKTAPKK